MEVVEVPVELVDLVVVDVVIGSWHESHKTGQDALNSGNMPQNSRLPSWHRSGLSTAP